MPGQKQVLMELIPGGVVTTQLRAARTSSCPPRPLCHMTRNGWVKCISCVMNGLHFLEDQRRQHKGRKYLGKVLQSCFLSVLRTAAVVPPPPFRGYTSVYGSKRAHTVVCVVDASGWSVSTVKGELLLP